MLKRAPLIVTGENPGKPLSGSIEQRAGAKGSLFSSQSTILLVVPKAVRI